MSAPKILNEYSNSESRLEFFLFLKSCVGDEPNPELLAEAAAELSQLKAERERVVSVLQSFRAIPSSKIDAEWAVKTLEAALAEKGTWEKMEAELDAKLDEYLKDKPEKVTQ